MTKTGEAARPKVVVEAESWEETWILYQKQIIIGVIVIAASIGGYWLWKRSAEIREDKATLAFQTAEAAFSAGNQQLAQAELEKITTRYVGTTSGTQASMLVAQLLYDQGKFAEGIAALEAVSGKAPKLLRAGILGLIGGGHEGAGQPAEAAKAYGEAAELAEFEMDRDMYRMEQARNLVAAGASAEGAAIYADIGSRDDSPYAGEAKVRLGEVTVQK